MRTLEELKIISDEAPVDPIGRKIFTDSFKKEIIAHHYESGISMLKLSSIINAHNTTIGNWKKKYGFDITGIVHGNTIRHDVRSQCLLVREYINSSTTTADMAIKANVSTSTFTRWIAKWTDKYQDHIDSLPDGVPYIVKEEKQVYGIDNINAVRAELTSTAEAIRLMIKSQHVNESTKKLVKKDLSRIENEKDILKKAEKILKNK